MLFPAGACGRTYVPDLFFFKILMPGNAEALLIPAGLYREQDLGLVDFTLELPELFERKTTAVVIAVSLLKIIQNDLTTEVMGDFSIIPEVFISGRFHADRLRLSSGHGIESVAEPAQGFIVGGVLLRVVHGRKIGNSGPWCAHLRHILRPRFLRKEGRESYGRALPGENVSYLRKTKP